MLLWGSIPQLDNSSLEGTWPPLLGGQDSQTNQLQLRVLPILPYTLRGNKMRKLYQCKAILTYSYKILVEDGQNEDDVANLCLDEVIEDNGCPKPDDIILREIKITKNLEGNEALYCQGDTFDGLLISDLLDEEFPEPEEEQE